MKKLVVCFATLCLLIGILTGCAAGPTEAGGTTTSSSTTTTVNQAQGSDGPGVCGVRGNWYFNSDWCDNYALDACVAELVEPEVFTAWANEFTGTNKESGTRSRDENNCWTFIREMNIPREKIEEVRTWCASVLPGYELYTDGQVEAIYNGTEEDIVREFASPYAIVVGTKIYSPKWLYEHTVDEYVAEGITYELFRDKLPQVLIACDTEDTLTTLLTRYDEFRRLQEPAYTGKAIDIAAKVAVNGKNYSAQWLAEHTAEEYRAAGITYDLLSENIIGIVASCSGTGERQDICDRYAALQQLEATENAAVK